MRNEVREEVALQTAVTHWQANGRSVYWLAVDDATPPGWAAGQLAFSQTINTPLIITAGSHSRRLNNFQVSLDVYQIFSRNEERKHG
ncbi:MAG: hypothetical protein R3D55_27815 [Chloroflexota bacterium]